MVNHFKAIFLFLSFLILLQCDNDKKQSSSNLPPQELEISFIQEGLVKLYNEDSLIKEVGVEFAETTDQRLQGLMYRSKMEENNGMLFIHPDHEIGKLTYWMKNTRIPLDIIYIAPDSLVINIAENAQPYQTTNIESAEKDAKFVLEIGGGLSKKWGIVEGITKIKWTKSPKSNL